MKTRMVSCLVCMLMLGTFVFVGAIEIKREIPNSQSLMNTNQSERCVLIAEEEGLRVILVDTSGTIIWEKTGVIPTDAEKLENGNVLMTNQYNVIEVDITGAVVWQKMTSSEPFDAERLPNGNTLITEYERVFEVDPAGTIVWEKTGLNHALDAEGFFTEPPSTPSIAGLEEGEAGTLYPYTFVASDPEGEIVFYYIDWGDGTDTGWIGPYLSGEEITKGHSWSEKGTYSITCKAKDVIYAESDWGTLSVTMPTSYTIPFTQFWIRLLEHLPNTFPLLRYLLGCTS